MKCPAVRGRREQECLEPAQESLWGSSRIVAISQLVFRERLADMVSDSSMWEGRAWQITVLLLRELCHRKAGSCLIHRKVIGFWWLYIKISPDSFLWFFFWAVRKLILWVFNGKNHALHFQSGIFQNTDNNFHVSERTCRLFCFQTFLSQNNVWEGRLTTFVFLFSFPWTTGRKWFFIFVCYLPSW